MLATQCSFCQHENTPGTRFCAECGSPMHLKVCPNPACGKVSDVGSAVCESCGQAFPKITLVSPDTAADAAAGNPEPGAAPAATLADKPRLPAWPLVMVAVVAGGLPLLWANRAQLPTPKTWQVGTPEAAKTVAPAPAPVTPPPAAAKAAPAVPPAPVLAPAPALAVASGADATAAAESNDDSVKAQPASGHAAKKLAKASPPKPAQAPRPCTEAVAALGLCDPKQAGK